MFPGAEQAQNWPGLENVKARVSDRKGQRRRPEVISSSEHKKREGGQHKIPLKVMSKSRGLGLDNINEPQESPLFTPPAVQKAFSLWVVVSFFFFLLDFITLIIPVLQWVTKTNPS